MKHIATLIATLLPVVANVGLSIAKADGEKQYKMTSDVKPAPAVYVPAPEN